jgi:flagellar protein FlgJ
MDAISSLMSLGSRSGDLPGVPSGPPDEAAKQLEGMFMSLLLKEMRQSIGAENGFAGDPSDTIGGLFDQMMGDHLAAAGGLGIADSIRGSLLGSPQS